MKTLTTRQPKSGFGYQFKALAGGLILGMLTSGVQAEADFQHNMLLNPDSAQMSAEARGRVMIYDGMNSVTVELAMNTQFDRIESMMFVNTRHVQPDGEVVEDDDC